MPVLPNDESGGPSDQVQLLYVPYYSTKLYFLSTNPDIFAGGPQTSVVTATRRSFSVPYSNPTADTFPYFVTDSNGGVDSTIDKIAAAPPTINVKGGPSYQDIFNGMTVPTSATGTLFADTTIGTSTTDQFKVCNTGSSAFTITSVGLGTMVGWSSDAATTILGQTVQPLTCLPFSITFTPIAVGTNPTTFTIGTAVQTFSYAIQGEGAISVWNIYGGNPPPPPNLIADGSRTPQSSDGTQLPITNPGSISSSSDFATRSLSPYTIQSVSVSASSDASIGTFSSSVTTSVFGAGVDGAFTVTFNSATKDGTADRKSVV